MAVVITIMKAFNGLRVEVTNYSNLETQMLLNTTICSRNASVEETQCLVIKEKPATVTFC